MTPTGPARRCRECGLELPAHAPHGQCPNCLLGLALAPESAGESDPGLESEWEAGEGPPTVFEQPGPGPGPGAGRTTESASRKGSHSGTGGSANAPGQRPKRILGDYELVEEIATGGMGVVWRARQLGLNRIVALKTLHAGSLASATARMRFRIEVESVARLNHPHIVSLFETGESDGVHFYTMTLVEGGDLAGRLVDPVRRPPLRDLVRLMAKVARAVDYAHQRGIIHRDLKPSNVLLDARGEPMIADFGLARPLVLEGDLTQSGTILGSPQYMAPEQARGDAGETSVAADIYSLGAMLYEVVAGRPPFEAPSMLQVLELARTAEPGAPSKSGRGLVEADRASVRDLDTIVLKCLSKEPGARYATARELAEELDRWLEGRPILARPVGVVEKVWRWCRREPALAVASAAVLLLLLTAVGGVVVHGWRMERANRQIAGQAAQLRAQNTALRLREAEVLFEHDESSKAVATLAGLVRADPWNPIAPARLVSALQQRTFARPASFPMQHSGRAQVVHWPGETGDDRERVLTLTEDGILRAWNYGNAQPDGAPRELGRGGRWIGASPMGDRVLLAGAEAVEVMSLPEGRVVARLVHGAPVSLGEFTGDGARFVTADAAGWVRRWRSEDGESLGEGIRAEGEWVGIHPLGDASDRVATVKSTGLVQVWDFETGRELWRRIIPDQEVPRIASTPDGGLLAFAVGNGVEVLDAVRGTVRSARRAGFGRIGQVRFDGQGERLALVSEGAEGHRVEVVPAGDVSVSGVFFTHRQEIRSVEFSRDGRRLLTASSDNTARIWDIAAGRAECEPLRHSSGVYRAVFSPDEQRVATLCFGGAVWVWRLPERVELPTLEFGQSVTAVGFARDGRHLAAGGVGGRVAWWQVGDGTPAHLPTPHVGRVWQVEFSGNGRWLASAGSDGVVQLVDLETRSLRRLEHTDWTWVMSVRFDSEDKRMVTAGHDRHVLVWDVATGQALADLVHPQGVNEACFSPDGKFVLTRSKEDRARLWDSGTGRLLSESMQHASWLDAAFFGPEGGHVLTASRDMSVRRWSLVDAFRNAREPLMEVRAPAPVFGVVRDSAGRNLAGLLGDQTVALWQGGTLKPGPVLEHAQNVLTADFDPAGSRLATAAGKAGARIWDVASGHPLSEPLQPPGLTYVVRFDPSGERLLTAGDDGRLRFWPSRPMTRPAPSWLPDFAEAQAVLVGDSSSGFHQVGVKTWRQIQEMWKGREGFDATTRDGLSPTPP